MILFFSFVQKVLTYPLVYQQFPYHCYIEKFPIKASPPDQPRAAGMSQLQFHCPASPMPAAPAPRQLGQPQLRPSFSIPCATSTLASESAGQPVRSSALPAGSATPYSNVTGLFVCLFAHKAVLSFEVIHETNTILIS